MRTQPIQVTNYPFPLCLEYSRSRVDRCYMLPVYSYMHESGTDTNTVQQGCKLVKEVQKYL